MAREAARVGRPLKEATPGTRVSLGLKVTGATKALIDERARTSGRTQSQEAELCLEKGLALQVPSVEVELHAMAKAAIEVSQEHGDPTFSARARHALRERWSTIAKNAIPQVETARTATAKAAISAMRFAAIDAGSEIYRAGPRAGDRLEIVAEHLQAMNSGQPLLGPDSPDWARAKAAFEAAAAIEDGPIAESLTTLLAVAAAASLAVTRAEGAQDERSETPLENRRR